MAGHDSIVIGASAGGVEALLKLVVNSRQSSAMIFVVQSVSATSYGVLAQILDCAGPLPATLAQDDEMFEQAHIYIAPPDYHLLVKGAGETRRALYSTGDGTHHAGKAPAADTPEKFVMSLPFPGYPTRPTRPTSALTDTSPARTRPDNAC
jgi:chemotaxis response regulator CheB